MQCAPRPQASWHKEYLWLMLQALGFDAGAEAATAGKTLLHVTSGMNMFDKPNKDAFYVVFHFLFAKLDAGRCKEVFRYCWPPLDKKKDAEFRKASCEWLKRISEDVGNGFPQVVASLFLSPGGPKFVQLLYHFTKYVMLQHIRRDVDDENPFIPAALQCRIHDPQKALARNKMARNKFLLTLQRENFLIKEYQKKAQLLVKEIRDLRSEYASLQTQFSAIQSVQSDKSKRDIKIEEVRSMWNTIMHTLKAMDDEMEVVDSVVGGDVDQFSLDGSNITLNIPSVLVTRIEREMNMLQLENVYEAGKVNLVTIIRLLNEALKIVKQENSYKGGRELRVDLQYLSAKLKFETEILQRLKHMRHKIKREDVVSVNKSIADKERDWEKKWKRILGKCPFSLFKGLNPILELQPPLAPLSFDPAADDALRNSVFSQYPVSLPELSNTDSSVKSKEPSDSFLSFMDIALFTPAGRKSLLFKNKMSPSIRRMSLNEKEFRTPTSNGKESFMQRSNSSVKRRSDTSWRTPPSSSLLHHTPTPCKQDARSTARLQLAQQVADYIVNESPKSVSRGMELDDLIGMLSSDPFFSRKEIPRTPENLISDIRTCWRKAIQTEEFSAVSNPLEVPCMDSLAEPEPGHCSQIDLSMACFLSTSHLSEQNDSPDARAPTSTLDPSSLQEALLSQRTSLQPEKVNFLKECENSSIVSPFVEKNQTYILENQSPGDIMGNTMLLSSLCHDNASAHTTLSWNSSNVVDYSNRSDSHEVIQFGILHETLPEGACNLSLNSTTSLETPEANKNVARGEQLLHNTDYSWKSTERKMDLDSIRVRYEALKRTFYTSLTEGENAQGQTSLTRVGKQKSESSLPTDSVKVFSPLDKVLSLDSECLMTPSPKGRKLSLPQLISFSPAEDFVRCTEDMSDVFDSHGVEALSETFDFTKPAIDLQKCTEEGVGQLIKL
ncbi:HAUS augmin-like complex subunit 6 [Bufo gargarizans]|uniref:HAUS augmin-like complex subunit 6 n=1 Tax=Bufo gargarizans TaxID=30331 RepID=UPI001CF22DA0|nr:HAUS augmin-like complex subunit 6 [Bufo gargarizans]